MTNVTSAAGRDHGATARSSCLRFISNTCELHSRDGGRVVVERLLQAVVLLQVEDVDQPVPAG